jgi:hypothetical protein
VVNKKNNPGLALIFFLPIILISSCREKSSVSLTSKTRNMDSIEKIYEFDTTLYSKHKSGFYLSKNLDVYRLNSVAYDDSTGFWSRHYWLDSLMFYGEYPNKKPLKDIIDLETFSIDSLSRFDKDKRHVYYSRATSDGIYSFIVDRADPKTFVSISQKYGKDKSNVFYGAEIVRGADIKSFQVLSDQDSAKDKNHLYYLGEKIK